MTRYPAVTTGGRMLAERAILYRPRLKLLTNNINAAILLSQINYWWFERKQTVFYKFAAPCGHRLYKPGDSWQEELAFTRTELETALKHIGSKIRPNVDTAELRDVYGSLYDGTGELPPVERIVLYWRDSDNVTWYELNTELQEAHLDRTYSECRNPAFANVEMPHYPANVETLHSSNVEMPHYPITKSTTQMKTTSKVSASAAQSAPLATGGAPAATPDNAADSTNDSAANPLSPAVPGFNDPGSAPTDANGSAENGRASVSTKPRSPRQQANDAANQQKLSALEAAWQIPASKPDIPLYLKVANALLSGGVPCSEFNVYVERLRAIAKAGRWTLSLPALIGNGRISAYVAARDSYQKQQRSAVPVKSIEYYDPDDL